MATYFKKGTDVFEQTPTGARHIDLPEFKSLGLNFDLLPSQDQISNTSNTNQIIDQETLNSGQLPSTFENQSNAQLQELLNSATKQFQQNQPSYLDIFKQSRTNAGVDEALQNFVNLQNRISQKQLGYQQGYNALSEQLAPEPFITGQQAALERRRQTELGGLTRQAEIAQQELQRKEGLAQQEFGATQADIQTQQQKPTQLLDLASRIFGLQKTQAETEALQRKPIETTPELIKEYNFAAKQGFKGTLLDFIKTKKEATTININAPTGNEVTDTAQQLISGDLAPSMLSKRTASYYKILTAANNLSLATTGKPWNAITAENNFQAAKRFVTSLNSQQMVRFQGLGISVVNTINEVNRLATEVGNIGITPLNFVKLKAYVNLAGNTPQGQIVAQYLGATNTLKEEFANLVNAGYAPTEAAFSLANQQINANYGVKELNASLNEVQRLINYRLNAFSQLGPIIPGQQLQTNNQNNDPLGIR